MITLSKYQNPEHKTLRERQSYWRQIAENAFIGEGLMHAGVTSGFITIEDTPGTVNYNPSSKMVKAVFYQNDTHTRYGYHAKFKIEGKKLLDL